MPLIGSLVNQKLIIQIRGTSGSGKTTLLRTVVNKLGGFEIEFKSVRVEGRRNPLYYANRSLSVLGSYESVCGGCDTIHGYDQLIPLAIERHKVGNVLMEGLLLSEDVKQTLTLPNKALRILFLDTPLNTCIERIKIRRAARGNDKPLSITNTSRRVDVIRRAKERLQSEGIYCKTTNSDEGLKLILGWLGIK